MSYMREVVIDDGRVRYLTIRNRILLGDREYRRSWTHGRCRHRRIHNWQLEQLQVEYCMELAPDSVGS